MSLKVQPVVFMGLKWAHPGHEHGRKWRDEPVIEAHLATYREELTDVDLQEVCWLEGEDEIGRLSEAAREADLVVVIFAELLSVRWAAKALESLDVPVVLHGRENRPTCQLVDLYGYLMADGRDVRLALNLDELRAILRAHNARKMLADTRALVIGDAYPSWSQVANPTNPEMVEEKLGVQIIQRSIDDLFAEFEAADDAAAEEWKQKWLDGATEVSEAAMNDILEIAKVYVALDKMVAEAGANALTVECRTWDEETMERYGRFFGPCMSLTTFRWRGIPAACEGDLCALSSMAMLSYVSGLPAFMGNIGSVDLEEGWVDVGTHAAATVHMDGAGGGLEGYRLDDYGGRGTGLASYVPIPRGQEVTIARLDKNLNNISLAAGENTGTDRYFQVILGDVEDFMHRCLVGDHYAVVLGDQTTEVRLLAEMLGIGVLEPGVSP